MSKAEENKQLLYDSIPKHLSFAAKEAMFRGMVAEIWFKQYDLTKDTQPQFNQLMKETNKEFKILSNE